VTEILGYLEDAEIEARRIAQGAEGRLRIGFVGSATYGILPSIIKSYRQHFPNVALSLYPMNNAALRRGLIRHEIDIGVARPTIEDSEINSIALSSEPLILAVPDTDPLADSESVPAPALENRTLILYPERPRPSFADHVLGILRKADCVPEHRIFAMEFHTAIALVAVDVGVCVVPASVGENQRKGVRFIKLDAPDATTRVSINHRIDNQAIHVHNFCGIAKRVARRISN
jgi:DNA-binding transcriptional LysR family regulator